MLVCLTPAFSNIITIKDRNVLATVWPSQILINSLIDSFFVPLHTSDKLMAQTVRTEW